MLRNKRPLAKTQLEECIRQQDLKRLKLVCKEHAYIPDHLFTLAARCNDMPTLEFLFNQYPNCKLTYSSELLIAAASNSNLEMFKFLYMKNCTLTRSVIRAVAMVDCAEILLFLLNEVFVTTQEYYTEDQADNKEFARYVQLDTQDDGELQRSKIDIILNECSKDNNLERYLLFTNSIPHISLETFAALVATQKVQINFDTWAEAIEHNRLDLLQTMAERYPVHSTFTVDKCTQLIDEACSGDIQIVSFLFGLGFRFGFSGLVNACLKNNIELVRFLHSHTHNCIEDLHTEEGRENLFSSMDCIVQHAILDGNTECLSYVLNEYNLPYTDKLADLIFCPIQGVTIHKVKHESLQHDPQLFIERFDAVQKLLVAAGAVWGTEVPDVFYGKDRNICVKLELVFKYLSSHVKDIDNMVYKCMRKNLPRTCMYLLLNHHRKFTTEKAFNQAFRCLQIALEEERYELDVESLVVNPEWREIMFNYMLPTTHDCLYNDHDLCERCHDQEKFERRFNLLVGPFDSYVANANHTIRFAKAAFEENSIDMNEDIVDYVLGAYLL